MLTKGPDQGSAEQISMKKRVTILCCLFEKKFIIIHQKKFLRNAFQREKNSKVQIHLSNENFFLSNPDSRDVKSSFASNFDKDPVIS